MSSADVQKTAALKVPILPHTSPEAPQPPALKTPLYPHQLRALHRCLLIENDGSLAKDFGAFHDYKSRGGCLADAVGMGKTATSIGLILSSPRTANEGDTLVVAPSHLIHQWADEISKFTNDIEVVIGKREYNKVMTFPPQDGKHRVVLVDVETVMNEKKYWYDFRRIFSDKDGYRIHNKSLAEMEVFKKAEMAYPYHLYHVQNQISHSHSPCRATREKQKNIQHIHTKALFCVQSPRGPCSYEGYVYSGPLHMPFRPWRRVIYDEIQDLVSGDEGTESGKNLLQLSRTAKNVWLLSATPFPHGNKSVYANHELLGFCRLRLDVEVDHDLRHSHPFEVIKRKLYIRSPKHVADTAVTASQKVTQSTIAVEATQLERKFFELEKNDIPCDNNLFAEQYASLRQMMVHPEASKKLREQINGRDEDQRGGRKAQYIAQKNKRLGRFATVNSFARHSLDAARQRSKDIDMNDIPLAQKDIDVVRLSLNLALKIRQIRGSPVQANPFAKKAVSGPPPVCLEVQEAEAIHSYYCRCSEYGSSTCEADSKAQGRFQTIGIGNTSPTVFRGYEPVKRIIDYFKNEVKPGRKIPIVAHSNIEEEYLEVFISRKERFLPVCVKKKEALEAEKLELAVRINALEETVKVGNTTKDMTEDEELKARNGSKCAALIEYLWEVEEKGESTIVFSYWHDTLALVNRSLKNNDLDVAFCNGRTGAAMSKVISDFTSGEKKILLLSAQAKASGANLQCATNVVLLDPAGSSAEHGATLEQQAVGRAVRMGQENAVKVVRFCVSDSIEEQLFEEIDLAAAKLVTRSNDNTYTCENAHKSLDKKVLQKKKLEDEEVLVGKSRSAKQQLARRMAEARAKNEIIVIADSDDEEMEDGGGKPKAAPVDVPMKSPAASSAPVKVKPEPVPAKRGSDEVDKLETSKSQEKRAKITSLKRDVEGCDAKFNSHDKASAHERVCNKSIDNSDSVMEDTAPIIASGIYVVEPDGKIHSAETLQQEWAREQEEFAKAIGKESLNSLDVRWLERVRELKQVKEQSGLAWVPGQKSALAKWCGDQRKQNSKRLKGQKNRMSDGRLAFLNAIGFPWSKADEKTPQKQTSDAQDEARTVSPTSEVAAEGNEEAKENADAQVAKDKPDANINKHLSDLNSTGGCPGKFQTTTASYDDAGRVVSPPAAVSAESTADADGLKSLLLKCELGEQYLEKFQEAGISSVSQLQDKLEDVSFMEKLVINAGLTGGEAIRLQIRAQK
ncbi:hypothetical protein ACHAXR_010525 [Thalassiosira sp. AJA248-18]